MRVPQSSAATIGPAHPAPIWFSFPEGRIEQGAGDVEGILLIVVYAVIASAGEVVAIGIGFLLDKISPAVSTVVFMVNSAIILGVAWPIALRATKSRDE